MRGVIALPAGAVVVLAMLLPGIGTRRPDRVPSTGRVVSVGQRWGGSTAASLSPVEEAIARHPFAPKVTRIRLARSVGRAKAMPASATRHGMGWAQPDAEYWRRIPLAARQIPSDWSGLPLVRFTNAEIGGAREIRLHRGPECDQWLLRDRLHEITACISVQRATRRVYFMQVARQPGGGWGLAVADDQCYSCHPSGPRVIRPLDEPRVDPQTLARFNRLMLSYGACDFGHSVDTGLRLQSPVGPGCARCHDGVRRGRLYAIHQRVVLFKAQREESMPPATGETRGG